MIIQSGDDPFVPPADAADVERAAATRPRERPTTYWHVAAAPHVQGYAVQPAAYRERVREFLQTATEQPQPTRAAVAQPEAV